MNPITNVHGKIILYDLYGGARISKEEIDDIVDQLFKVVNTKLPTDAKYQQNYRDIFSLAIERINYLKIEL